MLSFLPRRWSFSILLWFGVLLVFMSVALGCGGGTMRLTAPMPGGAMECSDMFLNQFIISQKDLGSGLEVLFWVAGIVLLSGLFSLLADRLLYGRARSSLFLRTRNSLLRLHDQLLRQFLAGILHPQIY